MSSRVGWRKSRFTGLGVRFSREDQQRKLHEKLIFNIVSQLFIHKLCYRLFAARILPDRKRFHIAAMVLAVILLWQV